MNSDLSSYYRDRANEYDKVYSIPEEREDLLRSTRLLQDLFAGKTVLEIACGTGYWTEQLSGTAATILATDINENLVTIAKNRKEYTNVDFETVDMYCLSPPVKFDGLFGGFIWSHIPLQELDDFLLKLASFIKPGGIMAFIDSKPVRHTIHDQRRLVATDEYGNSFQERKLENGTSHLVLKNFPTNGFLEEKLGTVSTSIQVIELENYWIAHSLIKNDS